MSHTYFGPRRLTSALAIVALAATFVTAPSMVHVASMDGAAYAKGGNGNGNGGNGGGNGRGNGGGGNGGSKSASSKSTGGGNGNGSIKRNGGIGGDIDRAIGSLFGKEKRTTKTSRTTKAGPKATVVEPEVEVVEEAPLVPLRPDQKGKWNAVNANQNALDAHIRNGKFNGTIGALAMYQLAGKAAAGEELTEDEQRALAILTEGRETELSDEQLEQLLNSADPEVTDPPVWDVVDGVATCVDNCEDVDPEAGNEQIGDYRDAQAAQDLLTEAEARIIADSNKSTDGIEEQLLDELAGALGFTRTDPAADDIVVEEEPEVVVVDEEIVPVVE